ncbi:uncharacterized protein LOC120326815 isoform X1 [Styela clava]
MTICGIPGCNYVRKTGGRSMFRIRRPDLARTPGERKHRQRLTNVMLSIRDFTKGDNIKDLIHKEACCICDNHFAKEDILDYGMKMSLRLGAMPTKNMPFPQCSVPGCHHPNGFRFPKRMRIKKKWIEAINRAGDFGKRKWKPNSKSNVCYQHFLKEDFCCDESGKILKALKPTAVPSIFNTYDVELNYVESPLKPKMKPKTVQELPVSSVFQDREQAHVNNVVIDLTKDTPSPDIVEKLFITNIRGSNEIPLSNGHTGINSNNADITENTNLETTDFFKVISIEDTKSNTNSEQAPPNTEPLSANNSLHKTVEQIPIDKKNGINENQMVSANPYSDITQQTDGGLGNNFERNMDSMPLTSSQKDTFPSPLLKTPVRPANASNISESCLANGNQIRNCETNIDQKYVKYSPKYTVLSKSHGLPLTNGLGVENQMEGSLSSNCETSGVQTSTTYCQENAIISNSPSLNNPTDLIEAPQNPSIQQSHNEANIEQMDIAEDNTLNSKLNVLAGDKEPSLTAQKIEIKKGKESLMESETSTGNAVQCAPANENSECATLDILLENSAIETDNSAVSNKIRVTNLNRVPVTSKTVDNGIQSQSTLSIQAKTNFLSSQNFLIGFAGHEKGSDQDSPAFNANIIKDMQNTEMEIDNTAASNEISVTDPNQISLYGNNVKSAIHKLSSFPMQAESNFSSSQNFGGSDPNILKLNIDVTDMAAEHTIQAGTYFMPSQNHSSESTGHRKGPDPEILKSNTNMIADTEGFVEANSHLPSDTHQISKDLNEKLWQSYQKSNDHNLPEMVHKNSEGSALIVNGKKGNLLLQQTLCNMAFTNFKMNKQKTLGNLSGKKIIIGKPDDETLISLRKRTVQKPQCEEKFDKSQAYSVGHEIKEYSALLKKVSMDNGEDPCVLMPIPGTDPQIYLPKNLENSLSSVLLANGISEKECILQRLESLGGDMRTLTGFDSYEHFDLFFNMLGPLALEMTSKALKSREQLFLVLVKLSGAKSDIEISKALKIGPTSVRIIYERWEEFMLNQLQSVLGTQKTEWMSGM